MHAQAAWIHWAGLSGRVWGARLELAAAAQGLRPFAALAYPAAAMRCLESFCYSATTVIAGAHPGALMPYPTDV